MAEGWEVRGPVYKDPTPEVVVGSPFPEDQEGKIPAYKLDLDESKDAQELHAIYRDLEFVVSVSNYLGSLMERREQEQGQPADIGTSDILVRSLYIAALVVYVRCFTGGKRKYKLDESIFTGDAEHLLERHRYLKDTRDKHVAHSVNAFEITETAAWINGIDSDHPDIQMVGAIHTYLSTDAVDDIRWMTKLATYVQTIVYGRMERANIKLSERVHSMPKKKLKELKQLTISVVCWSGKTQI